MEYDLEEGATWYKHVKADCLLAGLLKPIMTEFANDLLIWGHTSKCCWWILYLSHLDWPILRRNGR